MEKNTVSGAVPSPHQPPPRNVHDSTALEEIELFANLVVAIREATTPLSLADTDRALGIASDKTPVRGAWQHPAESRVATPHHGVWCERGQGQDSEGEHVPDVKGQAEHAPALRVLLAGPVTGALAYRDHTPLHAAHGGSVA